MHTECYKTGNLLKGSLYKLDSNFRPKTLVDENGHVPLQNPEKASWLIGEFVFRAIIPEEW